MFNKFFKKEKKNCLSCAFCQRERHFWRTYGYTLAVKPNWEYNKRSLIKEERDLFKKDDFSIIGKKIRDYEEWEQKRDKAIEEKDAQIDSGTEQIGGFLGIDQSNDTAKIFKDFAKSQYRPNPICGKSLEERCEILGINLPPDNVPEKDFLSCWHKRWNEDENPSLEDKRSELKNKKCQFFYSYNKKGDKTLEACEKERKEEAQFRISIKNNIIIPIIVGLTVAIIGGITVNKLLEKGKTATTTKQNNIQHSSVITPKAKQPLKQTQKPSIKKKIDKSKPTKLNKPKAGK